MGEFVPKVKINKKKSKYRNHKRILNIEKRYLNLKTAALDRQKNPLKNPQYRRSSRRKAEDTKIKPLKNLKLNRNNNFKSKQKM